MPRKPSPFPELRRRLTEVVQRAGKYQVEGLPIPTAAYENELDEAARAGDVPRAEAVVKRAEMLVARADQDWGWLRELLQRVDGLRGIAETVGLDLARIDARVGNPRGQLLGEALTPASLEKAAAGASFALAVLNDAIPKYIAQEAQVLGVSIRRARDRGEDVREAVGAFSHLIRSLQDPALGASAERLVNARKAVARIPRAPPVAAVSDAEEDEILSEARNLARRLHRIKTRAHGATDAVRLITQVRQALSQDRQYASPEEELEAAWAEVDRLAREKRLAAAGPALAGPGSPATEDDEEEEPEEPEETEEEEEDEDDEEAGPMSIVPPPVPPALRPASTPGSLSSRPTGASAAGPRLPMPIVPPVRPVPDEGSSEPTRPSPDALAEGAGPTANRPTRIAIASAYVPPTLEGTEEQPASSSATGPAAARRQRSRHRD